MKSKCYGMIDWSNFHLKVYMLFCLTCFVHFASLLIHPLVIASEADFCFAALLRLFVAPHINQVCPNKEGKTKIIGCPIGTLAQ